MDKIQSRFSIISANVIHRKLTKPINNFVPSKIRIGNKQIIQSVHLVRKNGKVDWYICKPNKYINTEGTLICVDGCGDSVGSQLKQRNQIQSVVVVIQDNIECRREMIVYSV